MTVLGAVPAERILTDGQPHPKNALLRHRKTLWGSPVMAGTACLSLRRQCARGRGPYVGFRPQRQRSPHDAPINRSDLWCSRRRRSSATSTTAASAAIPSTDTDGYATKKRVKTLAGLSLKLRTTAVQKAQPRPGAPRRASPGGSSQAGPSDDDLNDSCLEWLITWDKDANGNPIMGTFNLHCDGSVIPIG